MKVDYWQEAPIPRKQMVLFAERLEDVIPEDHPVRLVDEILSGMDWTSWEAKYDGARGQPPIHPSVMAKVLLFAIMRGIRSSRKMEYELMHSIDFMWLTSGRQIDHTTLSIFRKSNAKELKKLNADLIRTAARMGLAKLSEVCIDGTRVLANASRYHTYTAERVEKLIAANNAELEKALQELQDTDELEDLLDDGQPSHRLPPEVADLRGRQERLQEILAQLRQMEAARRQDGIDPQKNPAQLPQADLDSRILPNKEGGYAANYTPIMMSEMENGFIVMSDVLVGNGEHVEMVGLIDASQEEYGPQINTAMADSAFATGPNIAAMEEREIEFLSPLASVEAPADNPAIRADPTQPVPEDQLDRLPLNKQTKCFDKLAFVRDEENDRYYCPAGKPLLPSYTETVQRQGQEVKRTIYQCGECAGCPLANRCRSSPLSKNGRRVSRDEYEPVRARHSAKMANQETKERYHQRMHYGETPFAVLKAVFQLRRFLLRGIEGVRQEWQWATAAYNLKKLTRLIDAMRASGQEIQLATVD